MDINESIVNGGTSDALTGINQVLYLSTGAANNIGIEPHSVTGNVANLIGDIFASGSTGSSPRYFVEYNNEVYFFANQTGTM
jgi:hypothetical protein